MILEADCTLKQQLDQRDSASRHGTAEEIQAVFSVLGGVLLLDETLTPLIALGGVIVIAGVAIIMVGRGAEAGAVTPAEAGARRFDSEI